MQSSHFSPRLLSRFVACTIALATISACSDTKQDATTENSAPAASYSKQTLSTQGKDELSLSASEQLKPYLERDITDEIFYFVMPDRFHNGKAENDMGDPNNAISYGGLDKTSKWAFHGGDMVGLEAKLDYLQNLGITSIWMTPILRNKAIQKDGFGHHGYWVVDFTEIDPHFGSNDELKSLIDAAHARNIKVFFDIITNHTADVIKFKECHNEDGKFKEDGQKGCEFISKADMAAGKTYTPFVPEKEQGVKVPEWLNDPKYYNNQGDSTWQGESVITGDFAGLDDINTSLPEVQTKMIEIFENLISEFKPDGFRIDTVKHVDIEFWQAFGPAITEHAKSIGIPNFHIFGEVYDGNPAGLSKYTTAGKLPSVLDFGFFFNVKDSILEGKDIGRIGALFDNDDYYRDEDSGPELLLNFLGNHDAGRVGHFLQKSFTQADDATLLRRSELAHALMYFSRGVPVVYYGDEQGFTGDGGDVDARENMDPSLVDVYNDNILIGTSKTTADDNFDTDHPLYQSLAELAQIRVANRVLRSGIHQMHMANDDTGILAFSRIDPSTREEYLVMFNLSETPRNVKMSVDSSAFSTVYRLGNVNEPKVAQGVLSAAMPRLSALVLKASEQVPTSNIAQVTIGDIYTDNERAFIPVEVATKTPHANTLLNVTYYGVDPDGSERMIASDNTSPYRAVVMPEVLSSIATIRVEVSNYDDELVSETMTLN
ncbi:alpha-amylase family glycosyl hydrolase [Glaciecola siphonariae]|uniref:Alpha-amylase family glycosyl hydrolase n=1 Tax=Glaciecola siphonariae TaxID=521012 RepID=A0ABV9LY23_9ALTE